MAIKVQRKTDSQGLTQEQIVSEFRTALVDNSDVYKKSEIEELAALHAKSTTDNFIVSDKEAATRSLKQGDILIHGTQSKYYLAVKNTITISIPTFRIIPSIPIHEFILFSRIARKIPKIKSNAITTIKTFIPSLFNSKINFSIFSFLLHNIL